MSLSTYLRALLYVGAMLAAPHALRAQAPSDSVVVWVVGGNLGLNFSQVGLSNWAAGGKSTISVAGLGSVFANYKGQDVLWVNQLEVGYGVTKLGTQSFRKSDDRILLTSKFGYRASDVLNYTGLLDLRSQFVDAFNYERFDKGEVASAELVSRFFAPAFLNIGIGMEYKPNDWFSVVVSPVANRVVFVLDDSLSSVGAFGVEPGKRVKNDLGSSLSVFAKKDLVENVSVQTRLNMFSKYAQMDAIVVTWETLFNFRINSFMAASFATDVFYDPAIVINRDDGTRGPATQFRNVLNIGLTYKF